MDGSQEDAQRVTRLAFAGIEQVKEAQRDARSFVWREDARRDFIHPGRLLRRDRRFALIPLSVAIGIGANTAVFTVANALLRDPDGVVEADRLVEMGSTRGDGGLNPLSFETEEISTPGISPARSRWRLSAKSWRDDFGVARPLPLASTSRTPATTTR